ncbi:uncharacterized protein P884DRAFT_330387 [Thermothelomyces heterothallicus CBS 202.75]|uniref:uncharacterized protein n=1 Tax=Thermothelomyces heterothallicus CBS 202.75 TaxID=1149848 RepID=UPI00374329F8
MSSLDLDQAMHARARWRKAILIPLWIFQIAVLLCLMGIFAYRLAETFEDYEKRDKQGEVPIVEVVYGNSPPTGWEATNVGFNLIALVLNIVEIARMATERLTPFVMVFTQSIKLTLAFAVLALDIVAYLEHMDGHYSTVGLSLDCGLLAANVAALVYAATTYRRLLHYEDYHLTASTAHGKALHLPGAAAWGGGGDALELGVKHPSSSSPSSPPYYYDQSRSIHPSPSTLKREVDRAMSAEFGWGGGGGGGGGGAAAVSRSDTVVVASGTVPARHAAVEGLHRQRSWVTEVGVVSAEEADGEGSLHARGGGGGGGGGGVGGGSGNDDGGHGVMGTADGQGHGLGYPKGGRQDGKKQDEEEEALLSAR